MKVIETQAAVLSNHEVLTHLRHVQKKYTQPTKNNPDGHPDYKPKKVQDFKGNWTMVNGRLGGLRVVVEDLTKYLSAPPSCLTSTHATYSSPAYATLMQRLAKYNLTKSEMLMIFNWRPSDAMALDVIVEEADARFSEDEQAEILQAIGDTLGREETADADGDEEMGEAEQGEDGGDGVKEEAGEDEEAVM